MIYNNIYSLLVLSKNWRFSTVLKFIISLEGGGIYPSAHDGFALQNNWLVSYVVTERCSQIDNNS